MITISVCMIVKNEEKILARCLDSLKGIADEIIIVDTGSTDKTKEIAAKYTDRIYDYVWIQDFADARNESFSHATCDYIYQADADEVIDEENRQKFLRLKEVLLPEIDIVQMNYCGQLDHGTVYNFDREYRPKLFKRLRTFTWQDPVHESVRLMPVVYDSDIDILHMPENIHSGRDFGIFQKMQEEGRVMSKKLHHMYAQELMISGTDADIAASEPTFLATFCDETKGLDEHMDACCVLARCYRTLKRFEEFFKYALKAVSSGGCSEVCYELGMYYYEKMDYEEAKIWFCNAISNTEPILSLRVQTELAPSMLEKTENRINGSPDRWCI